MPCEGTCLASPRLLLSSQHLLVPSEGTLATCAPQNWATGDFTAFCKQIWTCSDPSSSINKSCQACTRYCADDTAPAFGSKLACTRPAQDGKQPSAGGPAKGHGDTAGAGSSAVPVPPPGVPSGLVFTKKKDTFNSVQPIFYNFNVTKVICTSYLYIRLHSFVSILLMSVCIRFKETSIYWSPP